MTFGIFVISSFTIVFLMSNGMTFAADLRNSISTSDQTPFDSPYQEWLGKWWGWWFGIPKDIHPAVNNYDSKVCSVNQDGPVWFLYDLQNNIEKDGPVNVDCSVPYGKGIMLPITTTVCDRALEENGTNLESCADNILTPHSQMIVFVDGVRIDVSNLEAKTGVFKMNIPKDFCNSCFGTNKIPMPGSYDAYATGYFLLLQNVSQGTHEIDLTVSDILKGIDTPLPKRGGHFNIEVAAVPLKSS